MKITITMDHHMGSTFETDCPMSHLALIGMLRTSLLQIETDFVEQQRGVIKAAREKAAALPEAEVAAIGGVE